jgi:HSP20 family protein
MSDFRLKQLHGRLGDLVYQFTKVQFTQSHGSQTWAPAANAYKCPLGFAICVDLAGVNKEEISVKVERRKIRLSGFRETPEPKKKEEEPVQILAMEIDTGAFSREITLPVDVEPDSVRAEYKDGFLWIYLPFRAEA